MSALLLRASFLFTVLITQITPSPVVVCYLGSWAVYRPAAGKFSVEDIDPTLCTHLIYSFAGLNENTSSIISLDPPYDITRGAFKRAVALKNRNPSLQVTIAIGGWTEGSEKYSKMASTSASRKTFIDSVVAFIKEHDFDGLDLDWEYPANRGGKPEDKQNFVLLCKELREAFAPMRWLLTAAIGAGKTTVDSAYDLPAISQYLDFIHLMAYDYHGKWDLVTGHNAPLYARDDESPAAKMLNVQFSVDYILEKGVPANKLIVGLPLYGRTFLLQNPQNPSIAAPATKTAFAGNYTREDGFLGYNEICELQLTEPKAWRVVWQKAHQAPFMFKDNMWLSYDDDYSLGLKVAFAVSRGAGGIMVWSVDTDDFRGNCGAGKYPLLRAINQALGTTPGHHDIDHDVENDNTLQGSSDASPLSSLQSFAMFALFCLVIQYLFKHSLAGTTGTVPKKYKPIKDVEEKIPMFAHITLPNKVK